MTLGVSRGSAIRRPDLPKDVVRRAIGDHGFCSHLLAQLATSPIRLDIISGRRSLSNRFHDLSHCLELGNALCGQLHAEFLADGLGQLDAF